MSNMEVKGFGMLGEVGPITTQLIKQELLPSFDGFEEAHCESGPVMLSRPNEEVQGMWKKLADALSEELGTKKKGSKRKRVDYRDIIETVELQAESTGFSNDKLLVIWKLVSHPEVNLNCTQRKALLLSMAPSEEVSADVIEEIVMWLERAAENGSKQSVVLAVYQLLNLYAAHELTAFDAFSNEIVLNRIIAAPADNAIIPWKMLLFRNASTPKTVSNSQLNNMEELLEKGDIKKTQILDVQGCLMVAEEAGRSTDADEEQQQVAYAVKLRELKYPQGVSERFEVYKARMEARVRRHPLANLVFPEQLPAEYSEGKLSSKTSMVKLLKLLETREGITELACNPKMLETFEKWLKRLMDYRFNQFCGSYSEEDLARYHFIFDVLYGISFIRQEGLTVLNRWLATFILNWDCEIFGGAIYRLIPYLKPSDILAERKELGAHLLTKFACLQDQRLNLWRALGHLFHNWMDKFFESNYADVVLQRGLEWLHSILDGFVTSSMVTPEFFDAVENQELIYDIVIFFVWLQTKCRGTEQTMYFTSVPRCLASLIVISRNPQLLEMAEFLNVASVDSEEGGSQMESIQFSALGLDSLLCGVLEPQMRALLPEQLLERQRSYPLSFISHC